MSLPSDQSDREGEFDPTICPHGYSEDETCPTCDEPDEGDANA